MEPIEKIYIHSPGDPDAGIPDVNYTISGDVIIDPNCFADVDIFDYIESSRDLLQKTFSSLLDNGGVSVVFDYEIFSET